MKKIEFFLGVLLVFALCIPVTAWSEIKVGGAVRVQYNYKDWDDAQDEKVGDFDFDTIRLNLDGEIGEMILSAEYRFYPADDWNGVHHAWIGYNFNEHWQGQIGVHQVPFGIQPFASHNFWFSGAYYVGLEDDYDMGAKALYHNGPWDFALAFYKNGELGSPTNPDRYSVDVLRDDDTLQFNEETNQGNIRLAYTFTHSNACSTEFGLSGEYGQLYNSETDDSGDHWAAAAHINGNYGPWNIQLEGIQYEYDPENPEGVDDAIIRAGAYSYMWGIPAKATIGIANISYGLPVNIGPISKLTFYSDNTVIEPDESDWDTTWQNVVGCMVTAGPVYVYIDVISGENMTFMGGSMVNNADGWQASNNRNTRLNINFGYYF